MYFIFVYLEIFLVILIYWYNIRIDVAHKYHGHCDENLLEIYVATIIDLRKEI